MGLGREEGGSKPALSSGRLCTRDCERQNNGCQVYSSWAINQDIQFALLPDITPGRARCARSHWPLLNVDREREREQKCHTRNTAHHYFKHFVRSDFAFRIRFVLSDRRRTLKMYELFEKNMKNWSSEVKILELTFDVLSILQGC